MMLHNSSTLAHSDAVERRRPPHHLRYAGQCRHRLRRPDRRHPGVRRRLHRESADAVRPASSAASWAATSACRPFQVLSARPAGRTYKVGWSSAPSPRLRALFVRSGPKEVSHASHVHSLIVCPRHGAQRRAHLRAAPTEVTLSLCNALSCFQSLLTVPPSSLLLLFRSARAAQCPALSLLLQLHVRCLVCSLVASEPSLPLS